MSENICMIEKHLHWVSKRTLAGFGQTHLTNSLYLYYFMCTYIFWVFLKIVGKSICGDVFMNMCVCERVCVCVITSLPLSSLCQWVCEQKCSCLCHWGWYASQLLVGYKDLWRDLPSEWRSHSLLIAAHVEQFGFHWPLGVPWVLYSFRVWEDSKVRPMLTQRSLSTHQPRIWFVALSTHQANYPWHTFELLLFESKKWWFEKLCLIPKIKLSCVSFGYELRLFLGAVDS